MFKGRMLRARQGWAMPEGRSGFSCTQPLHAAELRLLGLNGSEGQRGKSVPALWVFFSSLGAGIAGEGAGVAVVVLLRSSCRQGLL